MQTIFKVFLLISILFLACGKENDVDPDMKKNIIFLHHSTGRNIWIGGTSDLSYRLSHKGDVQKYFDNYNEKHSTGYSIKNRFFPSETPYGWKNYPYDYYNIWVKNAGNAPYMEEPTLEILSSEYDVIIFKHCYPVSNIRKDTGNPDIDSEDKRLENYKLQYNVLKNKMREFSDTKFIVWTPAVNVKNNISEEEALRTLEFYNWMKNEWDEKGDNIFIWDFYGYETEGGLYFLDKYAVSSSDSHPNTEFSAWLAPLFSKFIIDVIEGKVE